ncbi:MAG: hypothetical protein JXB50_15355 [Spirochaetes bacterium]|nr:hypothetical protein [Spirochaetota bacterium]
MAKSKRSNYLIDKPFQLGFIIRYVLIILITVIVIFSLFLLYYYMMEKIKELDMSITVTQRGPIKYKGYQVYDFAKEKIYIYKDADGKFKCSQPFDSKKYKEGDIVDQVDESILTPLIGSVPKVVSRFKILFWPLLYITLVQIIIISIYSIFFSHKMAGPIYRMKVSLDRMVSGDNNFVIKVRKSDFFINIIERLEKLRQKISKK